jgi:hypothetical protein
LIEVGGLETSLDNVKRSSESRGDHATKTIIIVLVRHVPCASDDLVSYPPAKKCAHDLANGLAFSATCAEAPSDSGLASPPSRDWIVTAAGSRFDASDT